MTAIEFDNSFARLPESFFAKVSPAKVPNPGLIEINRTLAGQLGIDVDWLRSEAGLAMLSGNGLPANAEPIAMAYAGHQFGGWSPQLGDGRAILIGEVVGSDGIRRDLQLKGAGRTPFSRQGDGKSPLGPVVREYLVSEAMAALGIPTTRALAAVKTGEVVHRETAQPGAVLARVAQSHVRVGTFEFFHSQGRTDLLEALSDYVIDRHYPDARQTDNPYRALLEAIVERQANLIAQWMQVGFVHGVMNTDNMQIVGETIDFGPCAFMENFDAGTVFSSIDRHGRYAWGNQPGIGQWNLTRLAEALLPLISEDQDDAIEQAKDVLAGFETGFKARFHKGLCEKLGLESSPSIDPEPAQAFVDETFRSMTSQNVDFTLFFRHLTSFASGEDSDELLALFDDSNVGQQWIADWRVAVGGNGEPTPPRIEQMRRVNPIFIPRNHRVEEAIVGALDGDFACFERLNRVLARPFEEQPEAADLERAAAPSEVVERTFCGT